MNENAGLPQNAPWVSPSDLVTPYQTIVSNPVGGFAARRGRALRRGRRPSWHAQRSLPPVPGYTVSVRPPSKVVGGVPRGWHLVLTPTDPQKPGVSLHASVSHVQGNQAYVTNVSALGSFPSEAQVAKLVNHYWPIESGTAANPGPLAWAGIGLGVAALAGGGYYLWQRQQAAALAAATGVEVNADCTKMTVIDPDISLPYFNTFVDTTASQMGAAAVDSLVVAAAYLQGVAPGCGVTVTEQGIEGVDTWQKAAMVGGLAILASGTLHDDGRMSDAQFREQAEAIQAFLLEHGIDDLAMVEEVFEMPETGDAQAGGGLGGGGTIAGRQANLGALGMVGMGVLGLGAAAAGTVGWLWHRNRKLTAACLGTLAWLEPDGSLSEGAEAQLQIAIEEALADGAPNAIEAADAAIVKVSENPDCRLPVLIWGDLLRVRGLAIAMAAHIGAFEDLQPPIEEGPGRGVTGLEADATCTQIVMHDPALSEAYFSEFMAEFPELQPGIDWVPNTIILGAQFLQRIAPHCGVYVQDEFMSEVIGVDTWQKAAMVGAFALLAAGTLHERGVLSDADFGQQTENIGEWLRAHGVDDLSMLQDVFAVPGEPGEAPGRLARDPVPTDEWGEPVTNEVVDEGSVGGEAGGRWRAYKDHVGEYGGQFYFVVWRAGEYTEQGPFATAAQAAEGALALLSGQQAGIAPKENPLARRGRLRNPSHKVMAMLGKGRLRKRMQARSQNWGY